MSPGAYVALTVRGSYRAGLAALCFPRRMRPAAWKGCRLVGRDCGGALSVGPRGWAAPRQAQFKL